MEHAISVKSLIKKYDGFTALDSVQLEVKEGEIFALLGPNGAGKTTLMRILTTQIPFNSGDAHVLGCDVKKSGKDVRVLVSYLPQEMSVWTDITGYENLLIYSKIYDMPKERRTTAIKDALETMELVPFANQLVSTYSGGMTRKLEIAVAIMIRPKVLFLDEPTIGLDPAARRVVWEKLKALNKQYGTTIFFSTHYMDEADNYADRIGIISHGKIMKIASAEELKHSIGDEVIELNVDGRTDGKIIEGIGLIEGVKGVRGGGGVLRISVKDSTTALDPILIALQKEGVKVKKVSTSRPTLDEVFLRYAGSKADSESGKASDVKGMRKRITGG